MKYLLPHWQRHRAMFFLGVFFVFTEAMCELLQPRVMSSLIDNGALTGSLTVVRRHALLMLGILSVSVAAAVSRNYIASTVSQRFAADLRLDLFKKIQSLPAEEIDSFGGGSLITRMTNDVTQIQTFANGAMRMFIKAPFVCAGAVVMSAAMNWRTVAVIIPIIAAVLFTTLLSMKMAYPRFAKMQRALDRLNTTMREYLGGIRLVRAFRRFGEEERRFSEANDTLTAETAGANGLLAVFSPFLALFVHIGIAVILLLGSKWVNAGDMRIGQIMAFVSYLIQILHSLTTISNVLNLFVRVRASSERIGEVFVSASEHEARAATNSVAAMGVAVVSVAAMSATAMNSSAAPLRKFMELRFDGVRFRYRGSTGQPALRDISFSLRRGETLGVIGPTGSGKSTIAALILRFYEPSGGSITLNGIPISDVPDELLRGMIALVPQIPALFTGTIRDNLLWGNENASDDAIRRAASAACALRFIEESPDGFNRVIGQGGVNLSGGQKQRVSIARALVGEPELLILDDCASALDLLTEARVRQALFDMKLSAVFITQRISTVSRCDKILALDAGEQVGFGSHEELMRACDVYRDIYISQIGGFEEDERIV